MSADADLLRDTWAKARSCGDDQFAAWFYATLTVRRPDLRDMFGVDMREQRRKLMATLNLVIAGVDRLDQLTPTLQRLGADHAARFGVQPDHYAPVGAALLDTLAHFLGSDWTPEVEAAWASAYTAVADVMATPVDPVAPVDPEEASDG